MNILGFATSNHSTSINKQLVEAVGAEIKNDHNFKVLDLAIYNIPLFSEDLEEKEGIPEEAAHFLHEISKADFLIISLAEHNGNYSAFYKNLFDWASRLELNVYQDKSVLLLSTSPGPAGAQNVRRIFEESAEFFGANIVASISLPEFYDNFQNGKITNLEFLEELNKVKIEEVVYG